MPNTLHPLSIQCISGSHILTSSFCWFSLTHQLYLQHCSRKYLLYINWQKRIKNKRTHPKHMLFSLYSKHFFKVCLSLSWFRRFSVFLYDIHSTIYDQNKKKRYEHFNFSRLKLYSNTIAPRPKCVFDRGHIDWLIVHGHWNSIKFLFEAEFFHLSAWFWTRSSRLLCNQPESDRFSLEYKHNFYWKVY